MTKQLMAELKELIALDIAEAQLQGSKPVAIAVTLDWLFEGVPAFEACEKTLDPQDFTGVA